MLVAYAGGKNDGDQPQPHPPLALNMKTQHQSHPKPPRTSPSRLLGLRRSSFAGWELVAKVLVKSGRQGSVRGWKPLFEKESGLPFWKHAIHVTVTMRSLQGDLVSLILG